MYFNIRIAISLSTSFSTINKSMMGLQELHKEASLPNLWIGIALPYFQCIGRIIVSMIKSTRARHAEFKPEFRGCLMSEFLMLSSPGAEPLDRDFIIMPHSSSDATSIE